jgi:hypothetical protein
LAPAVQSGLMAYQNDELVKWRKAFAVFIESSCSCEQLDRLGRRWGWGAITGSLSARMLFGKTLTIIQKGCVCEGRTVQKCAGPRIDVLLLGLIDYPCRVEAVSLYEHESRRRGVLDRKN